MAESKARIGQNRVSFLQGACFEQDRTLPFAPLMDMLRSLLTSDAREEYFPALTPLAPELVKLLPELALWLSEAVPSPAFEPEQEKRRLFVALTSFLIKQADQGRVLLVIEDVHWSDDTSLEFLHFLTRQNRFHPLLLVLTYRSDEVHPALVRFLSALDKDRSAVEFSFTALDIDEIHTMLRTIFRLKRPVRGDFLEALYELTEGNPFFVEEVLKSLLVAGDIFFTDGTWDRKPLAELRIPRSIRATVGQRTSLLSDETRETLELAAVIGKQVNFAFLQTLTGRSERELLQSIETLIAAQLLVETSAEQVAFRHALMQQAVYQGRLARKRRMLHKEIVQAMERLDPSTQEKYLSDLAYHSYEAQAWEQTLTYAYRIGAKSFALYAPRAAREHFTHALEAASHLPEVNLAPLYLARGQAVGYGLGIADFDGFLGHNGDLPGFQS